MTPELVVERLRRDPPRPGHRLRCRIDVVPSATSIPGSVTLAKQGVQEVVIHHEDLPLLEAKVEDQWDLYEQAKRVHAAKLHAYIEAQLQRPVPEDPAEWDDDANSAADSYTGTGPETFSAEAIFSNMLEKPRGIRPLRSCEVLEKLPGEVPDEFAMAAQVASQLGTTRHSDASTPDLQATIAEMRAEMAEMRAELDRRKGGRPRKD